jgi:hypothetical protein
MWQVIAILIIIVFLAYLYKRYETKYLYQEYDENIDMRKYLLGELTRDDIGRIRKPLMWIYIPHEYNSRNWLSFGSRSSYELNQPYLHLTIKSIMKHCNKDFHIILIDDNSFPKLLEDWPYIATPLDKNKRMYGLMNIVDTYGGLLTPISFLCFKSLIDLYYTGTRNDKMFVVENVNTNTLIESAFVPCPCFMGALKNTPVLKEFIGYLKNIIDNDYTRGNLITGKVSDWLTQQYSNGKINIIRGYEVGVMTKDESPVLVDDLMGSSYINIDLESIYGVWIPADQILKRTNYQWFARMSEEQVLLSNVILGKYIVKAVAPSETRSTSEEGFQNNNIQPMFVVGPNTLIPQSIPSEWVGFWNTPLYKGLYGLQPLYLGQDVPKNKEQDKKYKFVGVIS